ncbi:hypothetical protein [Halohasta litorea]|uniref:Uncharacterized protein n=1 Tax=Halohasta litorea TaxID=869891 RepID=A0ABD6DD26_9EURY|nr:hypothetical protein [Halohasta litorea]
MYAVSNRFESTRWAAVFVLGVLIVGFGTVGIVLDLLPEIPLSGLGVGIDLDLELLGMGAVAGAVLGDRIAPGSSSATEAIDHTPVGTDTRWPVFVTRPLLDALLEYAAEAEPETLSMRLATTPADRLNAPVDAASSMPVFTHLYLPREPNAVGSVFGVDLHVPAGRTHGRFLTHPQSGPQLTKRDDLSEVVFVAVPPWETDSVSVFDRAGRRHPLRVVDAVPPEEMLQYSNQ